MKLDKLNLDNLKLVAGSRRTRLAAGLLAVLLVAAAAFLFLRPDDELPDDAAFKVGDDVVTSAELEARVGVLESLYGITPPAGSTEESAKFRRASAQSIALSMIMDEAAADREIVVADKAASDVLDKIVEAEFPELGRAGYVRTLGNSGVTEDDVLAEIKRQIAIQQLFDEVTEDASVSDADVEAAFGERRDELATPQTRRISNIVVSTRAQALTVADQLKAGNAFSAMVQQYSLDASTRASAGDLGLVNQEQLEPGFGQAAFAARPGEPFGPVQSAHGWNVGVVRQVLPKQPATYGAVAETLKAQLQSEEALSLWRGFLEDELADADVEYAEKYRPADPDALPETGGLNAPSPALPTPTS